jgi:hypothetical protein
LAGREPAVKGVTIYPNPGGYDHLTLVRIRRSVVILEPAAMNPERSNHGYSRPEIYKRGLEWADRDGDNQTAQFDVFTNVLNGFRIFDYRQFVRLYCDKASNRPRIAKNGRMRSRI